MIVHLVTFTFVPGTTTEQVDAVAASLDRLASTIPAIRSYRHGRDLGVGAPGLNSDYGIVATFDDIDGWRAYDQDDLHNQLRATVVKPLLAGRSSIQFEV